LKGNAYDLAPVSISGEISPYQGEFNVEMNFMGMPMPLISPYMVQFAGYKVEKGKLNLGLHYQVSKGQLTASNNILIDQFELGEKVDNPDAVPVPLELAVGLLKDSSGKIKMDVPITGSLEDPKFSVGKIIVDALLNSISKIVTSPFKAIASLVGNEENLDAVRFAPGKAELDQEQVKKLYGIAGALKERPILSIDIKGAAYQEQDWPALRESALYDRLKKMKADEINKQGGRKTLAEYVELSEEEYKRLLAQLFIEKFPLLADRSLFGTPRLKDPKAGDFYEVAKQKLAAIIKPEPNRLKNLASERSQAIAKYLVQQGGVQNERVYILDPAIDPKREGDDAGKIISFLSLKAQ
jgi:outer membrane protein OmpA-like peptidoglycan-associated protein